MVLGLLPKEKIRAVSFEADSDTSFAVPRALGIERLRPQLEDIVAARPAVVVRSYGGDARLDGQLNAMGIREIGRASCGERVCQYGEISVVHESVITKQNKTKNRQ